MHEVPAARLPSHRRTGARDAIRGETGALLTEVGLIMRQALDLTRQLGTVALLAILTVGFGLGAGGRGERAAGTARRAQAERRTQACDSSHSRSDAALPLPKSIGG